MEALFPTLYAKVGFLLAGSMLLSALGVYIGRYMASMFSLIVLAILFIGGAFGLHIAAQAGPGIGISYLLCWTFIAGLFIGPAIQLYAQQLGWQTVGMAFLGTAGAMTVFGGIGMFSGIDFSGMGSYLAVALWLLIIVGIVSMFIRMSREGNILYAIAGLIIFSGYFIFDFFRLSKAENSWPAAINLSANLFLDFVNFMMKLLELLAATQKHH